MRYGSWALTAAAALLATGVATAGTQVKGTVVANDSSANPQLSAKSKFGMKGTGDYVVILKGITDGTGNPAPVTSGTTADTQYFLVVRGDVQGTFWQYNIPFNITTAGQAKLKGSVALISQVPAGAAVGILGVAIHEPATATDAAACDAILSDPNLPGVYVGITDNPCASGARVGLSGILTGQ